MLGHELISGVEAAAHKLCKSLGLQPVQIVWTSDIQTAAINSKGNMLLHDVALDAPVSKAIFHRYVGFVVHELLHRKYTDFSIRGKGKYLSTLHNAVEDIWIERMAVKQGVTGNIEGLLSELIDGMVIEALAAVKDWTDPMQYPFALAVFGRRYAVRQVPLAAGLERIFSEASCRIDNCLNSADTLAVAEWVLGQLQLPEPKQEPKQEPEQGEGEGEGEGEEQGEGEGEGEGSGAGAGEGQEQSQGEGEGAGEGSGAGEAGEAAGEAAGEGEGDKPGERKQVGGAESPAKEVEPGCPVAGDPGPGGKFDRGRAAETWGDIYASSYNWPTVTGSCGKIRNEIKRLLENTGRSDWSPHRKAGSLNVRSLPSISTGNVNLFKRRDEVEGVDSAVLILLDNSGSMEYLAKDGTPRMKAAVPVVVALHAAATAAGASVAVDAFSIATSPVVGWGVPTAKLATLITKINPNYNTNDYQAVRLAGDKLLARPEQRKILIVITDGNGDRERTAKHVAALERCGVTVIGVGIMLDSDMTDVYPSSISVKNLQDLASASFKHIKVAMA